MIERGSEVLHVGTRKATALLALLSRSNKPLSRENLAALFWPEFGQARAHANLRRTLFAINQILGPEILVSDRKNIGIDPNASIWQDTSEFCTLTANVKAHVHPEIPCSECIDCLEKAVSLYQGDFLEGINLKDCPEFDDWQDLERENFRSELAFALSFLAQAYSAKAEWGKAILRSRQWVSLDRLHEPAQRMLIQIYALSGQQSAALRQYEECTRLLRDELGRSPEEETITLVRKIQTGGIGKSVGDSMSGVLASTERRTNEPVIKLKLFVPRLRTGLVSRPHLIAKLNQGAHCALTLISAPAGYGKTTLLSEWIDILKKEKASVPWTVCWLSLDAGDNDPIRFLTYLTAALESARPELGAEARSLLQSTQYLHPKTPLSILINDLQEFHQPVILVLDDYQLISNPTIHEGIIFLLEHLPSNVHLVIATRSDPPLPLARLRGRNQLNELRAADLRFTSVEVATFLNKVFDLSLTPKQITVLENRTEGWIAGLQLAAISMQGRLDIAQFIDVFSGSHRFIMDYLAEEALNRQPKEIKIFLLCTSILERLSDSLCNAVLAGKLDKEINNLIPADGFSFIQDNKKSILQELERSNLFIVPLDNDRTWYRYHHLFSDLLRVRLKQTSPELIPILHIRASAWFEKNGWIEESVSHSLTARDWDNASRLIEQNIQIYLENGHGQMATVMKWVEGMPQDVIFRYPKLCIQVAELYAQAGMIDHIDPLLNRAEEMVSTKDNSVEDTGEAHVFDFPRKEVTIILSMIANLRGLKAVCSGDPNRAINLTQKALSDIPEMESSELAVLFWVEGWAHRSLGMLDQAMTLLTKATEFALESGRNFHDIWTDLGVVNWQVGKLQQAIKIFTGSIQRANDRGVQKQGNLARDEAFLSFIYLEQNQLDLAFTYANRAIEHTQWWPSHNIIAMAYASIAQILLARNDLDGSLPAIQKADQERKNRLMTPFVHSLVEITWARVWLMQNEWGLLDQWSNDVISKFNARSKESELIDEYLEMQLIMLIRVWLEKTKIDRDIERNKDCLRLLTQLENNSRIAGRVNSLVEILILKESIRFSQGKTSEALKGLDQCLSMAEPGGYMRIFINTGEPARALLSAYLRETSPIHKSYALNILKAFGGVSPTGNSQKEFPLSITCREMEVLHLLAEGYNNRQIAEKLVLAEGTVKFHVHRILGKLQVESRTQAIVRAKDLNLI